MKKLYILISLVFLCLGLSGCIVATVGECIIRDNTSRPCN